MCGISLGMARVVWYVLIFDDSLVQLGGPWCDPSEPGSDSASRKEQ